MALPSSGQISLDQMHVEAGGTTLGQRWTFLISMGLVGRA
jgi:hypothetical protein